MRTKKLAVPSVTVLLGLAVMLSLVGSAAAERKTIRRGVEPGGEVLVAHHKRWDKSCRPLPLPTVKITRPPTHGTATIREGTFEIDETWHPNAKTECRGTSVPGRAVYYSSDPRYRGPDTFEYEVTLGATPKNMITFQVEVEIQVR